MNKTRNLGALAAALLAGACTVGPNYHARDLPVPATFAEPQAQMPGADIDPAQWWTGFGDPQLETLVQRALKNSPDMAIAASRVRQARLSEVSARGVGRPTIDATANATHIELSKNSGISSIAQLFSGGSGGGGSSGGGSNSGGVALPGSGITTYALGFDASWELDIFGGGRRQVEGAVARTSAAVWNQRDAAVTLAAEVAQAYFSLRLDQNQIAIVTDEIARENRALAISGHIATAGLVPQSDVTRQRGTLTALEARLEPLKADVRVRVHALGILIGEAPETIGAELTAAPSKPLGLPGVPAGLPSDLLRRRPDIRAAERNLAAATADIGVAVADLYPKFQLTGLGELLSTALGNLFSKDSLQATATGGINFPLLDWGRRRATVAIRKEQAEEAYARYKATVLGALRDVEDPLARLDAERRRNDTLRRAVQDQESTARSIEARYRTGFVAQDELLNAQVNVLSAREQVATSDMQLREDTASLFKAIGGGWNETMPAMP